ncbi:MAG: Ig domain-containing protein, partial [Muribaculaceae bacterium]|nr:Ig domain-containing protein [Muribaculaceae bacterium]
TLDRGTTTNLQATVLPDNAHLKTLTWSSSNTTVATVKQNGLVTAVAPGTATITIITTDGTKLTDSCLVTLKNFVHGIALKTSTVLYKTEQEQLEVIFTPDDATERAVEWASSNPSVATVDENGRVTAHAVGTATITATSRGTVDGALLTATCAVEVRSYVESITLNKTETLIYQGENELLTATILPDNAFNQAVVWSTSDPEVATVDNTGMVTAVTRGTATITATTTDGTNLSATCQVDVHPPYALEIDSLSHIRGAKAETVEVPVRLINKNAISGLQFNITLPAGVTMAMFDGMPDVWLNDDRKARNHSVDVSQLSDNQYLVLVSSPTNREFKDNDGPVVYMNLELAQYHDAGEYSIVLSDILLNEADETEHRLDDFSQKVKFYYMLGDADADTHVDVADYTAAALTILKRPTIRFYHDAANVNDNDEVINLTDLTGIVNIVLGNREAEVRLAPACRGQEDESQVLTGSMALTGHYALANSQLTLGLDNGNAVAAMQMDIALPGGATLKDAALTGRAGKHQLSMATLDDGRVRVLVSAFSDAEIAAGEGTV